MRTVYLATTLLHLRKLLLGNCYLTSPKVTHTDIIFFYLSGNFILRKSIKSRLEENTVNLSMANI